MQLLNKLSEILHKFFSLIIFFIKIVVLKAASDSKPLFKFQIHQQRSSRVQMVFKISVPENLANFRGKHLFFSLILIKLQTLGLQLY